jgi:hypothetical protein
LETWCAWACAKAAGSSHLVRAFQPDQLFMDIDGIPPATRGVSGKELVRWNSVAISLHQYRRIGLSSSSDSVRKSKSALAIPAHGRSQSPA